MHSYSVSRRVRSLILSYEIEGECLQNFFPCSTRLGGFIITDREVQIEALWTYEISTEILPHPQVFNCSIAPHPVLNQIAWTGYLLFSGNFCQKKGFITQSEADEFSENLFEQLDTKKISGFHPSPLREKMCAEHWWIYHVEASDTTVQVLV